MSITIYGASDGLIEVEGDIREEFSYPYDSEAGLLAAVSDGTLLRVQYTKDGTWRITPLVYGAASYSKVEAAGADTDNYSDRVTLAGEVKWLVIGEQWARP